MAANKAVLPVLACGAPASSGAGQGPMTDGGAIRALIQEVKNEGVSFLVFVLCCALHCCLQLSVCR